MSVDRIPYEVWLSISTYLREDLTTLMTVNRAFLNIVLDERYRDIFWVKMDAGMIKSLIRLNDPFIAKRVRHLHLRAWFIHYILEKEISPREKARIWVNGFFRRKGIGSRRVLGVYKSNGIPSVASAQNVFTAMVNAVSQMTNVNEYSFEWRDLPLTTDSQLFVNTIRSALGMSLRKLTLSAQLPDFNKLLSTVDFDELEELSLHFDFEEKEYDTEFLFERVSAFLNHFTMSLRSLTISSSSPHADMSILLVLLRKFFHLKILKFTGVFSPALLSDPLALINLVNMHSATLQCLDIHPSPIPSKATLDDVVEYDESWNQIGLKFLADARTLHGLTCLTLRPFHSPTHHAFLECVYRSSNTLTRLSLVDDFLNIEDLQSLTELFAHRCHDSSFEYLKVGVETAITQVFDLFAVHLPAVGSLNLVFKDMSMMAKTAPYEGLQWDMRNRFYSEWELWDVGIWYGRCPSTPVSAPYENRLMMLIDSCVPNLKSFKGYGCKWTDEYTCPS